MVSTMAIIDKKTPKRILSRLLLISFTSIDVQIAKIMPKKEKTRASKTLVSPFFILNIRTKKAMTTKEKILITCALFCHTPSKDSSGISTVPPPSPIAPRTPASAPNKINNANILSPPYTKDFIALNTSTKMYNKFSVLSLNFPSKFVPISPPIREPRVT